jgi:hypothetical protein
MNAYHTHGDPKPQRLNREIIHQSPWVNLYADKVKFPGGRIGERHYVLAWHHGLEELTEPEEELTEALRPLLPFFEQYPPKLD